MRAAEGVELVAELGEQQRQVGLVGGGPVVAGVAVGGAGPLPVEVDAVEDAGAGAGAARAVVGGEVALDPDVDAGGDELLAGGVGGGRVGEVLGVGPAAERDHDLEVRVLGLELLELVEVAAQRRPAVVGDAVHGLGGAHRAGVVGVGVARAGALVGVLRVGGGALGDAGHAGQVDRVDVLEGVVDDVELGGAAGGVEVLDEVLAAVDAPLHEVADPGVLAGPGEVAGGDGEGVGGRGVVVGGVAGPDGEGVRGGGGELADGGGGAGDGLHQGAALVDVVRGDPLVVGGGVPGQRDAGGGDAGGAQVAGRGGRHGVGGRVDGGEEDRGAERAGVAAGVLGADVQRVGGGRGEAGERGGQAGRGAEHRRAVEDVVGGDREVALARGRPAQREGVRGGVDQCRGAGRGRRDVRGAVALVAVDAAVERRADRAVADEPEAVRLGGAVRLHGRVVVRVGGDHVAAGGGGGAVVGAGHGDAGRQVELQRPPGDGGRVRVLDDERALPPGAVVVAGEGGGELGRGVRGGGGEQGDRQCECGEQGQQAGPEPLPGADVHRYSLSGVGDSVQGCLEPATGG